MTDLSLDDLRDELSDFAKPIPKRANYTPLQERVIAGFEDILRFHEEHGRPPEHGEERDIFERLYAVRLDRIRMLEEHHELLESLDEHDLLHQEGNTSVDEGNPIDTNTMLAELKDISDPESDIFQLKHVQSREEKRAAEEIANREQCEDFDKFKPLFEQVDNDLKSGARETRPFVKDTGLSKADITKGQFFIVGGQTAYIADAGETIKAPNGEEDARLRVVYDNGTESNLLRRSLQRALYKDEAGRRVSEPSAGPLFGGVAVEDDLESGLIYILRSQSDHPEITPNRELIHKIGVTGGKIENRIANAKKDPTFLLAGVEIVATYQLFNINRSKLENLVHRFFSSARLDLNITDRFGDVVKPREWFLVPFAAIDDAVGKIQDGTLNQYKYDPASASIVEKIDDLKVD